MLRNRGYLPGFLQSMKNLSLPGEIGGCCDTTFPEPLACRRSAVPAGLRAPAGGMEPVSLLGSLQTLYLPYARTSRSQSLDTSAIPDSHSLAEAFFTDKPLAWLS